MSTNTCSETVPFKIKVWGGEWHGKERSDTKFVSLNKYLEFLANGGEDVFEYGLWRDCNEIIKYRKLLANLISKEENKVFYVNEHEYENVGGEDTCFFSDERSTLERFCEEWGFDKSKIEVNQPVMQSL